MPERVWIVSVQWSVARSRDTATKWPLVLYTALYLNRPARTQWKIALYLLRHFRFCDLLWEMRHLIIWPLPLFIHIHERCLVVFLLFILSLVFFVCVCVWCGHYRHDNFLGIWLSLRIGQLTLSVQLLFTKQHHFCCCSHFFLYEKREKTRNFFRYSLFAWF